jgi:hypothetical protein
MRAASSIGLAHPRRCRCLSPAVESYLASGVFPRQARPIPLAAARHRHSFGFPVQTHAGALSLGLHLSSPYPGHRCGCAPPPWPPGRPSSARCLTRLAGPRPCAHARLQRPPRASSHSSWITGRSLAMRPSCSPRRAPASPLGSRSLWICLLGLAGPCLTTACRIATQPGGVCGARGPVGSTAANCSRPGLPTAPLLAAKGAHPHNHWDPGKPNCGNPFLLPRILPVRAHVTLQDWNPAPAFWSSSVPLGDSAGHPSRDAATAGWALDSADHSLSSSPSPLPPARALHGNGL